MWGEHLRGLAEGFAPQGAAERQRLAFRGVSAREEGGRVAGEFFRRLRSGERPTAPLYLSQEQAENLRALEAAVQNQPVLPLRPDRFDARPTTALGTAETAPPAVERLTGGQFESRYG